MTRARDLADGKFDTDVEVENSSGATLKLTSTDTTGADTELLGQIDFVSSDTSTGSAGTQARIKGVYEDNGDSSGIAFITGASTGSGTPTISEKMRIRHEGHVGIGVSDVRHPLHISYSETGSIPTDHQIGASTDNKNYIGLHNSNNSATYSGIALETRTSGAARWLIANEYQTTYEGDLVFRTRDGGSSGSEITRFTKTGISVGKTDSGDIATVGAELSTSGYGMFSRTSSVPIFTNRSDTGDIVQFYRANSLKASISISSSAVTYNTSSDRRLKQDIEPLEATDKLMAMNPVSFVWKTEPEASRSMGFIAQEVQEIMPQAVSTRDDGMMQMDYGRITPILASALQDAHKKIEQLESRLAALEAS